jgi:hypothetical protein
MAEPNESVLSREQIRQALAVLREEQQAHPISSAQRRFFVWYRISIWCFFISLFLLIGCLVRFSGIPGAEVWFVIFFVLLVVSFLAVLLLFFLNMKLIFYTWREFRLALKTRLWQLATQMHTGRRWPRRLMVGIGAFLLVALLAGAWIIHPYVGIPLAVALLAFFFLRFARRRLDMLRNTDQLVVYLTKLDAGEGPTGIGHIAIPTGVFKEIGAIEDIHIQRSRAKAIDESRDGGHGYAVVKSRAMIADIAKLDEASQLKIEARIAELATESPLAEATIEPSGTWRVPVTETPYEIVCRQDQAAHRIELLSLGQIAGTSSTDPTVEAPYG